MQEAKQSAARGWVVTDIAVHQRAMKRSQCMQIPSADFSDLRELTLLLQSNHPDLDVVDMELDPLGPLQDHGVAAITAILRQNCVVTEVNLANNGFGHDGAKEIAEC